MTRSNLDPPLITREEAMSLGLYNAEWYSPSQDKWFGCGPLCAFSDPSTKYRMAPLDLYARRISPKQAEGLDQNLVEVSWGTEVAWYPVGSNKIALYRLADSSILVYRLKVVKTKAEAEDDLISAFEARKLGTGNAEWFSNSIRQWEVCSDLCAYQEQYKYRRKVGAVTNHPAIVRDDSALLPSFSSTLETTKETTMSSIYTDSSVPVTTVTLVYGRNVKDLTNDDFMGMIRRIDGDIDTLTKAGAGSTRIAAKIAELKAQRDQVIATFDAAAPAADAPASA